MNRLLPALAFALSPLVPQMVLAQSVVTWGGMPNSAPPRVSRIVANTYFAAGILPGGVAARWGDANITVPEAAGQIKDIAISSNGVVVLRTDGSVFCWIINPKYVCNAPSDIQSAIDVAATSDGSAALLADGTVRHWGLNANYNLSALSGSSRIEGEGTILAGLRPDGTVRLASTYGSLPAVPAAATQVRDIALHATSYVVARADGSVFTWGSLNEYGYLPPSDLGPVVKVAARDMAFMALQSDGRVRVWGNPNAVQQPPANMPPAAEIAGFQNGFMARLDTDCNQNGVRDSLELADHDCNGNQMHDSCEAQVGALEDCNGNGLGDTCEKQLTVDLARGHLGPIGINQPQLWTIPNAVLAATPVKIRVRGHGDFSGQLEYVTIQMGNSTVGTALAGTNDCGITPWREFTVADFGLNSAIDGKGRLTLTFETTIAVDPLLCPDGTWIEAELSYVGAAPSDCNANGLLDACEIAAGLAVDANGNGAIDICESALTSCPADFDQNGQVNGADLAQLLNAWGPAPGLPGLDLNPDGVINGADLSILLNAWGVCAE